MSRDGRDDVAFVGAPASLEGRLATGENIEFISMPASGWDRSRPLTFVKGILTAVVSVVRLVRTLGRRRIDVVAGFGGYASLPVGVAAIIAGVPLVLHEQNSVPGLVNRVLSRWASAVCVTYAGSAERLAHPERTVLTGNPVREAVLKADRESGRRAFGIVEGEVLLLVFGGSRGARHLNSAIVKLYHRLREVEGLRVIQIAGQLEQQAVATALHAEADEAPTPWWTVLGYVDDMGDLLAAADLVVCRAGATSLAELSVLGRPSVLVPYPHATDDHQTRNAEPFVEAGAAAVFADRELDDASFGDALLGLIGDPAARERMAQAASSLGHSTAAGSVVEVLHRAARRVARASNGRSGR